MDDFSDYEQEREAQIARNRALLAQLDISLPIFDTTSKAKASASVTAKPVRPAPRAKRQRNSSPIPVRQSARLKRSTIDPNETPAKRRKREQEEEERRKEEEEERLAKEEQAREAERPRHQALDLDTLVDDLESEDIAKLKSVLEAITQKDNPRRIAEQDAFCYDDDDAKIKTDVAGLKEKMQNLKVVARAKVTQDRIYSAAYHPEVKKDLIFFGDKHGQLGIWDARAPVDEITDEDGEPIPQDERERGKYWQLQPHWPANSKSAISNVKFNPTDSHSVYTSSYDCTIRSTSFTSGISTEIFTTDAEALITCIDMPPSGHEMWISDALGGITHLDLRQDKTKARWYQLSDQKIGSVSVNTFQPHFLLTASNDRSLKIWDARKLQNLSIESTAAASMTPPTSSPDVPSSGHSLSPLQFDTSRIQKYLASKKGKTCLRAEWRHGKSVSAAFWDPRGRSIVSTSYDNTLKLWEYDSATFNRSSPFASSRPFREIKHNCQTGRWVTVFKAQWSPNPDVYPHFTIGNMERSLDVFSGKGDLIARLSDNERISAVQAVTCSHPNILERAASGNASGRCVLWAPPEE